MNPLPFQAPMEIGAGEERYGVPQGHKDIVSGEAGQASELTNDLLFFGCQHRGPRVLRPTAFIRPAVGLRPVPDRLGIQRQAVGKPSDRL